MGVSGHVSRRPIPQRGAAWAVAIAQWLQRAGVRPNQVSLLGVGFAAFAACCFVAAGHGEGTQRAALLLAAAAAIPLRLLCNMLDGMLAVEGGLQTPAGELYNEMPDRIADLLFLAGAGYAIGNATWGPQLGWAAAAAALLTAYTRTLGVAAGAGQHFIGPMAKPRRMHVLFAAVILAALAAIAGRPVSWIIPAALVLIIAGCLVTIVIRWRRIVADLESR